MSKSATAINVALGIFNAFMLVRSRRVSLMVVPTIPQGEAARGADPNSYEIRVQVVNLSTFPVYVGEVGLQRRDDPNKVIKFEAPADRPYPILLNSRESIRVVPATGNIMRSVMYRCRCAYARTECGRTRRGTSPTLQAQEINVLKSEKASFVALALTRLRHLWEGIASRVGSVFW
ncbi:hypothetical protein N0A02_11980 [Paraburkholderia acidicola]|uniref:Pili assembly chaperone N-terminal domain-containing protein n=1 Tax=Paraburkholderia acidicola TaxID=1912599 RepID=A0ABV1LLI7_9BURK